MGVINQRIRAAVQFHDVLHGFWAGWEMGTTSLEVKFIQQLTAMREEVLYELFLDLRKSYKKLDRERCMDSIVGYIFGLRTERIICNYWDHLSMVAIPGSYYGIPFKGHQWVTQGGSISHTIFNMVFDAVIVTGSLWWRGRKRDQTALVGRSNGWRRYFTTMKASSPRPGRLRTNQRYMP